MIFRSASLLLALLIAQVSAKTVVPDFEVKANSKLGKRLLSKARALNDNNERDWTWVAKYSIKYRGCSSLIQLAQEGQGGGGEDGSLLYTQNLVKFSLCPSDDTCDSCKNGADYVVNMMEFLDAWTENKMNTLEQTCENIRENCYCNNQYNDDEACQNQCYTDAEMTECIEIEGEEEFEIQRYLECAEMENQNGNNNNNNNNNNGQNGNYNNGNWYGSYYIGPYCSESDGYSIHLGVFYDEGCSARADSSAYADRHYGVELPYSSQPIIEDECISCMQVDEDNNNNNNNQNNNNNYNYYQELEVNELCEAVYEPAAKCESNIDTYYPETSGCEYIQNILPRLEKAIRGKTSKAVASGGGAATGFAWLFGITTIIFASYAFFLYRKLDRNRVDLSSTDGALA